MRCRLLWAIGRVKARACSRPSAPVHVSRGFGDVPAAGFEPSPQWNITVSPFIKIKCRLHCDVTIRPLDPHRFPAANRALIEVHGLSDEVEDEDAAAKVQKLQVQYDDQRKELTLRADEALQKISVHLTTPVKSDLHVVTHGDGGVKIHNMESDVCQVWTERGPCVLQSVKSHKMQVCSSGGNITGVGTIHGDVDIITAGDGNVDIKKIQGTAMNVSTDRGSLKIKAIYAESCVLASASGNIHIGHAHGETQMQSDTGDIIIDSSSHALRAHTDAGNIDAYVSQTGTAQLHSQQGSVSVRLPSTIKAWVQLCGATVDIDSEITQKTTSQLNKEKTVISGQLNNGTQEDCWIKATAVRGAVNLKTQSWLETLKLGK